MMFDKIGKVGMLVAMAPEAVVDLYIKKAEKNNFKVCVGQAGSMDFKKIVSAIETAAINTGIITSKYWEKHSLYHAALEAFHGIGRGQMELGNIMRTVGLRFAIVRGARSAKIKDDGNWIAVAIYGTIGAPIKGSEHEIVGLGINHI